MKLLLAIFATVFVLGGNSFAHEPSATEMRANFQACTERSPYWTQRWGQYVVAFDRDIADAACRKELGYVGYTVKTMGCRLDGSWKVAGFYCEELSPGGN